VDPFVVEPDSPLTAWGQVQRDLRRRIESREFEPGARIPSEVELVRHYSVSRMTVRRAIEALTDDGLLRTRRGAGTFVTEGAERIRCDVDLLRPWREQLLASGHVARSRLVEFVRRGELPPDLRSTLAHDDLSGLGFGLHVQEVDGVPVAVTESWVPTHLLAAKPRTAPVSASASIRIAFGTEAQARLLESYRDVALLEVTTAARLRETGELAEIARTWWVGGRVRFVYGRSMSLGNIDMSELLPLRSTV
jgi:DNA-binding GntR family transcriptional regulator